MITTTRLYDLFPVCGRYAYHERRKDGAEYLHPIIAVGQDEAGNVRGVFHDDTESRFGVTPVDGIVVCES